MGIYMLYEGYLALVGYAVVFAAAWYWIDRKEVLDFTKTCLTVLAIVLGVLALLEHYGMCYYNNFLVQKLGALPGIVGYGDGVVMTFGNADYFGMYCAMLLPLMTALIAREGTTKRLVAQLIAAVLLAAALLLSHVMNAILIGFGLTLIFLVVWAFHTNWKRAVKGGICGAAAAAVVIGGFGFLWSRSGDTFSEKFRHTMIGAAQEDTFRLQSVDLSENTVALHNADTTLEDCAADQRRRHLHLRRAGIAALSGTGTDRPPGFQPGLCNAAGDDPGGRRLGCCGNRQDRTENCTENL